MRAKTRGKMNSTSNNISTNSKGYFQIHHFMTKVLGLGGAKLLVYALIYSFTVSEGSFFGSRGYMAEACGTSVKTVDRALRELVNSGLLLRGEVTNLESIEYKANISPQTEGESQNDAPSKKSHQEGQKVLPLGSECRTGGDKLSHNNKDYTKTNIHTSTQTVPARAHEEGDTEGTNRFAEEGDRGNMVRVIHEGKNKAEEVEQLKREIEAGTFHGEIKVPGDIFLEDELIQRKHGLIDAKRNKDDDLRCTFVTFGYQNIVMLTDIQYSYLSRTYGEDVTEDYIRRLENCILSKPGFKSYSHYKTIIKWLKEDMSCADMYAEN